jgi:hypothetical protein
MSDKISDVREPKPPPIKTFAYSMVSAASIAIVVYVIYQLIICGCGG